MNQHDSELVHEGIRRRADALGPILTECISLIKGALGRPASVQFKGKIDLVTETDLAVEATLTHALQQTFPDDAILGEEKGQQPGTSGYVWIIDPIDGTTNFSCGLPHFCISVGLTYEGTIVYGRIVQPISGYDFSATLGRGATLNGKALSVSTTTKLNDAVLATGFSYDRQLRPDNNVAEFDHLLRRCRGLRRMGAAALDFAYVAAGWLDGYWEYRLKPWDAAAGILMVTEAGGKVTTLAGDTADEHSPHFCVSNAHIHDELLWALKDSSRVIGTGLDLEPGAP
ncbi:MAG: inositol monophosphatase family protein [Bradymonadia bacterium]